MFFLVAFPDAVNAGLARLSAGWSVLAVSAELTDKGPVLRSLFAISILAVPFLLSFFPLYAALRGVKVYEQFVEGARSVRRGAANHSVPRRHARGHSDA